MALKFMLDTLEGLDETTAALYVKHQDGNFYLDVDGAVSKTRLDEFRNNNVELLKKLEDFEGVDAKEYKSLVKMKKKFDTLDDDTEAKVKAQVSERIKTMQEEFNTKIKTSEELISTQSRQLESLLVDSAVRKVSTGKALPSAIDDVLLRAKSVFKVEDGVATPYDDKGNLIYGKDGANPMTIDDWVGKLSKEAPHLFEQSAGAGAPRNSGGQGAGGTQDPKGMSALQKITAGLNAS